MKESILIVLLFLLLHPFVIAQESPSSKKNELSLDILSFTRNNTIPGIVYKRKFKNAAFRIKLNSSFKSNEVNNTTPSPDSLISTIKTDKQNRSSNNQLFIGYERNKHIDSKWTILYGADLVVDFSFKNTTEKKVFKTNKEISANISTVTNETTNIKYGLSPFVG